MSIKGDVNILRRAHERHERVQMHPEGESLTVQSERENTNINLIMARYEKTGLIDHVRTRPGEYLDVVAPESYHAAMNIITDAQAAFNALPASLRKRFDNDPEAMLAFCSDPENEREMIELGMMLPSEDQGASEPAPKTGKKTAADPSPEDENPPPDEQS